jgi:hypothetical protein
METDLYMDTNTDRDMDIHIDTDTAMDMGVGMDMDMDMEVAMNMDMDMEVAMNMDMDTDTDTNCDVIEFRHHFYSMQIAKITYLPAFGMPLEHYFIWQIVMLQRISSRNWLV